MAKLTPEQFVEQLLKEHVEVGSEVLGESVRLCNEDGRPWPCPTILDLRDVEGVDDGPLPEVIEFKYYLNDSYSRSEFAEFLEDQTGITLTEEQIENIGRPFYEVEFACKLDTKTWTIDYEVKK
jgi:hypothetical protein